MFSIKEALLMHEPPDFEFLRTKLAPLYHTENDWLSAWFEHVTGRLCFDQYCSTCGAGPYRMSLRLVWSSNYKDVSATKFEKIPHKSFSDDEIQILIDGFIRIKRPPSTIAPAYFQRKYGSNVTLTLKEMFYPKTYIFNPLMQLMKFIWERTSQSSLNLYGDPHEFLRQKLKGTDRGDIFNQMFDHWKQKQQRLRDHKDNDGLN